LWRMPRSPIPDRSRVTGVETRRLSAIGVRSDFTHDPVNERKRDVTTATSAQRPVQAISTIVSTSESKPTGT